MRKETITQNSYVHVINRGNKQMPIYRQKSDLWRLLFSLYYVNSSSSKLKNWMRELERAKINPGDFVWPEVLGERKQMVYILGFVIMPNHFHLVLKEIDEGGISNFMHRFSMGYSKFLNIKYNEVGSLFQGKFQSKIIETDEYLRRVAVYVMVKNTFELYPNGGLRGATKDFENAWAWAGKHPFSSLPDYAGKRNSPILDKDILSEIFDSPKDFKDFSKDYILGRNIDEDYEELEFISLPTPSVGKHI